MHTSDLGGIREDLSNTILLPPPPPPPAISRLLQQQDKILSSADCWLTKTQKFGQIIKSFCTLTLWLCGAQSGQNFTIVALPFLYTTREMLVTNTSLLTWLSQIILSLSRGNFLSAHFPFSSARNEIFLVTLTVVLVTQLVVCNYSHQLQLSIWLINLSDLLCVGK